MNIPELRFPEFSGEWKEKKLSEFTKSISSGKTNSKSNSEKGKYKIYGSVGVIGFTDEADYDGKCVLIARVGANAGKTNLINEKCGVSDNTLIIKYKNELMPEFSYYYFENYNLNRLVFGSGQPLITGKLLKNLRLKIPFLNEQEKIASFLSKVDEKIEKLEKKQELWETYKKGMMQKIFSQELRFKDENGEDYPDWEEKRFEELMEYGKAGGTPTSTNKMFYGGSIPFLSIADMTSQGKFINYTEKYITEEGLKSSSAWVVPKNSLIYSIYASVGSVAINKSDISTSQAIFGIILKEKTVKLDYVYYYLLDYQKYIHKFIETGTQGNLNAKTVRNLIIKLPKIQEQTKISHLLSSIDKKIDQLEKELEFNKEFKKGLLQQVFM